MEPPRRAAPSATCGLVQLKGKRTHRDPHGGTTASGCPASSCTRPGDLPTPVRPAGMRHWRGKRGKQKRKSRFIEEQIIRILGEVEGGATAKDVYREHRLSTCSSPFSPETRFRHNRRQSRP